MADQSKTILNFLNRLQPRSVAEAALARMQADGEKRRVKQSEFVKVRGRTRGKEICSKEELESFRVQLDGAVATTGLSEDTNVAIQGVFSLLNKVSASTQGVLEQVDLCGLSGAMREAIAGARDQTFIAELEKIFNQLSRQEQISIQEAREHRGIPGPSVSQPTEDSYQPKAVKNLCAIWNLEGRTYLSWADNPDISSPCGEDNPKALERCFEILYGGEVVGASVSNYISLSGLVNDVTVDVGVREVNGDGVKGPVTTVSVTPRSIGGVPAPDLPDPPEEFLTQGLREIFAQWEIPRKELTVQDIMEMVGQVSDASQLKITVDGLPWTEGTPIVMSIVQVRNNTQGFDYDFTGAVLQEQGTELKLDPTINGEVSYQGDSVTVYYRHLFEDRMVARVVNSLTLEFLVLNEDLTPLWPLSSILRVENLTLGVTYDVSGATIGADGRTFTLDVESQPGVPSQLEASHEIQVWYTHYVDPQIVNIQASVSPDGGDTYSPWIPLGIVTFHSQYRDWGPVWALKTRQDTRLLVEDNYGLMFRLSQPGDVYVGVDLEMSVLPRWLNDDGWTQLDTKAFFIDGSHSFRFWTKSFDPGDLVNIGGNRSLDFIVQKEDPDCGFDRALRNQFPYGMLLVLVRSQDEEDISNIEILDPEGTKGVYSPVLVNYGDIIYQDENTELGWRDSNLMGSTFQVGQQVCFRVRAESAGGRFSDPLEDCVTVRNIDITAEVPELAWSGGTIHVNIYTSVSLAGGNLIVRLSKPGGGTVDLTWTTEDYQNFVATWVVTDGLPVGFYDIQILATHFSGLSDSTTIQYEYMGALSMKISLNDTSYWHETSMTVSAVTSHDLLSLGGSVVVDVEDMDRIHREHILTSVDGYNWSATFELTGSDWEVDLYRNQVFQVVVTASVPDSPDVHELTSYISAGRIYATLTTIPVEVSLGESLEIFLEARTPQLLSATLDIETPDGCVEEVTMVAYGDPSARMYTYTVLMGCPGTGSVPVPGFKTLTAHAQVAKEHGPPISFDVVGSYEFVM
jgi:hypothetical protein